MHNTFMLNLHFFGDEGQAASTSTATPTAAGGKSSTGANSVDAAPTGSNAPVVKYGIQYETQQQDGVNQVAADTAPQAEQIAPFEELIKGRYKKEFDERVQNIVQNRLRNSKAQQERLESMNPLLDIVAGRYGLIPNDDGVYDIGEMIAAVENDTRLYEDEAMAQGIPTETYMHLQQMQRENARYQRNEAIRAQEEENQRKYIKLMQDAEELKKIYPSLDLEYEMQNETFGRLIANNVPLRAAYEVAHRDEIISGAMQFAAQKSAAQVAESVASGARRPAENGMSSQAPVITKSDPSKLTKEDRADIRERIRRGEKIAF